MLCPESREALVEFVREDNFIMSIARINQNVMAQGAYRNLSVVQNSLNNNVRHFSTGLRIEGAKDDATGLAISERFRSQITGYETANKNAQDANNMLQVADGALNETHALLQRLRQLSLTSANDATTQADRANIQTEVNQLLEEIDNISQTTQYNGRVLLDGSLAGSKSRVGSKIEIINNPLINVSSSQGTTPRTLITDATFYDDTIGAFYFDTYSGPDITLELKLVKRKNLDTGKEGIFAQICKSDLYNSATGKLTEFEFDNGEQWADLTLQSGWDDWRYNYTYFTPDTYTCVFMVKIPPISIDTADIGKTAIIKITGEQKAVTVDKSVSFQTGANQGQAIGINLEDMSTSGLRIKKLDVMNRLAGQNAVGMIDDALEKLSTQRANIGASQQRIASRISSNELSVINQRAAESRIRDVDFASETLSFTRNQILTRSGTAVLAQANSASQSVLSLLGRY